MRLQISKSTDQREIPKQTQRVDAITNAGITNRSMKTICFSTSSIAVRISTAPQVLLLQKV